MNLDQVIRWFLSLPSSLSLPQLHRKNFRTQTQNSTQFFFTNYVETKLKDTQQLHKDKTQTQIFGLQTQNSTQIFLCFLRNQTQNSKLKSQIDEKNPRSETTNSHSFRERERVGFLAKVERDRVGFSV